MPHVCLVGDVCYFPKPAPQHLVFSADKEVNYRKVPTPTYQFLSTVEFFILFIVFHICNIGFLITHIQQHIYSKCPKISHTKVSDKMTQSCKQCRPKSDCSCGAVWSKSTVFAIPLSIFRNNCIKSKIEAKKVWNKVFEIFMTFTEANFLRKHYIHISLLYLT